MGKRSEGMLKQAMDEAAKGVLMRCLGATNGDVAKAARNAGINRSYFYCLLKRYGLRIHREKQATIVNVSDHMEHRLR